MWTRAQLKNRAKLSLHESYWQAFAVTILVVILANSLTTIRNLSSLGKPYPNYNEISELFSVWTFVILVFGAFLGNVIQVGMCRYFVRNHYGDGQINHLFDGFRSGSGYRNIVGAQFTTRLIIGFYTFLFIIPGIVVSYKYYMVPYLLSEDPNMSSTHVRELSARMTNGEKWNIFVLELSFIGWYLVGLLCLIVGVIFVNPYYQATKAELYILLRDRANIAISSNF